MALALVLVWGANFSVQKAVFDALSPGGFLFVRYLVMPVAAALLLCWRHGLRWPRLPRERPVGAAQAGLAGHLLHVGLVTYGIHWSTAFSSSLILACGPVFTLADPALVRAGARSRAARSPAWRWPFSGVLVFLSDKLFGGQWQASGGDLTLLVAASFFSYYTVLAKPLIERLGSVTVMAYATLMGSAPVVLLSLPAGLRVDWAAVGPGIWAGMFYAVLISAFLGWMVWGWVNAVRGVARTAPLMYLCTCASTSSSAAAASASCVSASASSSRPWSRTMRDSRRPSSTGSRSRRSCAGSRSRRGLRARRRQVAREQFDAREVDARSTRRSRRGPARAARRGPGDTAGARCRTRRSSLAAGPAMHMTTLEHQAVGMHVGHDAFATFDGLRNRRRPGQRADGEAHAAARQQPLVAAERAWLM